MSPGGMVVIAVVLMLALAAAPLATEEWYTKTIVDLPHPAWSWIGAVAITGIVVVSFVATVYWGMRLILRHGMKGWPLALGILGMVALWLLPLFVEAVLALVLPRDEWTPTGLIAGISPGGTLALAWSFQHNWTPVVVGLVVQVVLAAAVSGWGILVLRERRVPAGGFPVVVGAGAPPVVGTDARQAGQIEGAAAGAEAGRSLH